MKKRGSYHPQLRPCPLFLPQASQLLSRIGFKLVTVGSNTIVALSHRHSERQDFGDNDQKEPLHRLAPFRLTFNLPWSSVLRYVPSHAELLRRFPTTLNALQACLPTDWAPTQILTKME